MEKGFTLTPEEVSRIILEVSLGERIVDFKHPHPYHPSCLILRQPSGREKLWADFIEKKSMSEALDMGLPREDEIPEELIEQFFTTEDQEKLETFSKKHEAYSKMVSKGIEGSVVHKQNKQKVKELQQEISLLKSRKDLAKQLTADFKATEDRYYALLSKCVLNINREPIWNSLSELEQETDIGYLETLLYQEFLPFFVGHGTTTLRYIARSGQWGARFYSSKSNGIKLFSQAPEDLSIDQLVLMSWSTFYFDISQMAEDYKPSEEIIDNDEALDDYLDKLSHRMKADRYARKKEKPFSSNKGSKLKAEDHQNVIVTASNREYVSLHKQGIYNDPKDLSKRVKDPEQSTTYSESAAVRERKNRQNAERRERARKLRNS